MMKTCLVCLEEFKWIYPEDHLTQVCEACFDSVVRQWIHIRLYDGMEVYENMMKTVDIATRRARFVFQTNKILERR